MPMGAVIFAGFSNLRSDFDFPIRAALNNKNKALVFFHLFAGVLTWYMSWIESVFMA